MALIRSLVVALRLDTKQYQRGIKSAKTQIQGLSVSVRSAVAGIATSFVAFEGMKLFGHAIKSSSDFKEEINKSREVFGQYSKIVEDSADAMQRKFGYAKTEFLSGASAIGLIGEAAGMSEEASAQLGSTFAQTAADIASFYNVDVKSALDDLQSGLVGQVRPLRKYGVLLNETAVNSYLAAQGAQKLNGEYSEGAKVSARIALIQAGLAKSTGDLARTSGGTANQMREAWGRAGETLRKVGDALEPVAQKFLQSFNSVMVDLATSLEANQSTIAEWASGVGAKFQSAFDWVATIVRHSGSIWESVTTRWSGGLRNVAETIVWLGDTAQAFLDYLGQNWLKVFVEIEGYSFRILAGIEGYFVDLAASIADSFASGFQKPIKINLIPQITLPSLDLPAFQAPELKLSSVADDLEKITQKELETERIRLENAEKRKKEIAAELAIKKSIGGLPSLDLTPKTEVGKKEKEGQKFAAAFELGSKEARSIVLEHRYGSQNRQMQKIAQEQLATLKQIAEQTKAREAGASVGLIAASI